jgi:hypothetical protein
LLIVKILNCHLPSACPSWLHLQAVMTDRFHAVGRQ